MNNCEETGIVRLEDLPKNEIFVELESGIRNLLEKKIRFFGIEKFGREIGSGRIIGHWLSDGSMIRFDILLKVLNYFNLSYKDKIIYIRGKDGFKIKHPKLPFDFTSSEGVRIIAGILGDGGIPTNRPNPYYTNSNEDLIGGYIKDMVYVFGEIEFGRRNVKKMNTTTTILEFPSLVRKVFLSIGLIAGKKIENNPDIPKFIFSLDDHKKFSFISQFFDDEGSVNNISKHLSISSGCLKYHDGPNLLIGIKKLLFSLDIHSSIYPTKGSSITGKNTRIYRLQIDGQFQIKLLAKKLDLRIPRKKEKLLLLSNSFKKRFFPRKRYLSIYIEFMKKIQESKGFFTSLDLSKESGMVVGSCRNALIRFREGGLIVCIKPYSRYPYNNYARYVLR